MKYVCLIPILDKPLKVTFEDSVSIEKGEGEFEYIITKKALLTDEEIESLKEIINNVSPISGSFQNGNNHNK